RNLARLLLQLADDLCTMAKLLRQCRNAFSTVGCDSAPCVTQLLGLGCGAGCLSGIGRHFMYCGGHLFNSSGQLVGLLSLTPGALTDIITALKHRLSLLTERSRTVA